MLMHRVQNKTDRVNNGSQQTCNGKATRDRTVRIPYIMQPKHEQVTESIFPGMGMQYYLNPPIQSAVVQRQFKPLNFSTEVYMKKIREVLKEEYQNFSIDKIKDLLYDMKSRDVVKGNDNKVLEMNAARLDILINLYDHLDTETSEGKNEFTHYLMLEKKAETPEGGEEEPVGTLNSETTNLLSAIDCKVLDAGNGEDYAGALFIESYVSTASGEGSRLLRKVLNTALVQGITKVVLGAFKGTEKHYTDLGFDKKEGLYSGEGEAKVMGNDEAIALVKEQFGDIEYEIEVGIEKSILYPIYTADIATVLSKIPNINPNLDSQRIWVTGGNPLTPPQ